MDGKSTLSSRTVRFNAALILIEAALEMAASQGLFAPLVVTKIMVLVGAVGNTILRMDTSEPLVPGAALKKAQE